MSKHTFYDHPKAAPREAVAVLSDRCSTCARWLRVKDWKVGSCGKRGWRTDENDWCRFHSPQAQEGAPS